MILVWYGFAGAHNGIGMVWGSRAHNGDGMVWGAGAHNGNGMVWYGHGQLGRGIESNNTVLMCRDAESMTWSVGLTHCILNLYYLLQIGLAESIVIDAEGHRRGYQKRYGLVPTAGTRGLLEEG